MRTNVSIGTLRLSDLDLEMATSFATPGLTSEEHDRLQRLKVRSAQQKFVLARWLVRYLLDRELPQHKGGWIFVYSNTGKPTAIHARSGLAMQISLSHCDGLVAAAIHPSLQVGVDTEHSNRKTSDGLIEFACTEAEQRLIFALPESQQSQTMIRFWTVKEAVAKACDRVGLANLTKICGSELSFDDEIRAAECDSELCIDSQLCSMLWDTQPFKIASRLLDDGHFCTLAVCSRVHLDFAEQTAASEFEDDDALNSVRPMHLDCTQALKTCYTI